MSDEGTSPASAESGVTTTTMQGVILGDHGVQFNWFKARELDAQRVKLLGARPAARYVAELGAEDAAYVLAIADSSASARVLQVLLTKEKDFVMSVLAVMNRDKAEELLQTVGPGAAGLARLPEAAEAIADYEDTGVPELGEATGELALAAESPQGTRGFYQNFQDGQIHWTVRGGAQPTRGAIARYHIDLGGSGGGLGFPLTPDVEATRSPFGTEGTWQRFESSWDYPVEICDRLGVKCGATLLWCDPHGVHRTWGRIGELYELEYGTGGWLGFPVSDDVEAGPSHRNSGGGTTGWCQRFEGGAVYFSEKTGGVAVPGAIADYHEGRRGAASRRGFPVSREMQAAGSRYGTTGQYQRFEGAEDYPDDILKHWSAGEGPGGATIYSSAAYGTYCVGWGNGVLYERLGGTASWLGFPKSDETDARMSPDEPRCTVQEFEGGAIFYKEKHGSVTVSSATMDYLARAGLRQRIGFPIKRGNTLAAADEEPVQFFEHGVVTVRKGKLEAWLRPDDTSSGI